MPRRGQRDRRFIELVERLLERWGYSRTEGKVYAILLMRASRMA